MTTSLVVIDCQNDFIKDISPYSAQMLDEKLIEHIKNIIDWARKKTIPIIYTQHGIKPDRSNAEFGEPKDIQACIIRTRGWRIIEALKPRRGELVVHKDKYDAFYRTNLEKTLRHHDIDTLILTGVLTNNCIRATAEGAHYRGFKLFIVSDCCGGTSYLPGKTDQEIHDITLRDLQKRMYETNVVTFSELKKILTLKLRATM